MNTFLKLIWIGIITVLWYGCSESTPPSQKTDLFISGEGKYAFYRIPGVVVTAKGTILAYCEARRDSKHDWSTLDVLMRRSTDGGDTWSEPYFDEALWDTGVMAAIIRVDENTIAFANPHSLKKRENLSIKLSKDDGKTWPIDKTIEAGPSAYPDLAVSPDGTILCLYERGSFDGKELYGRITLARFGIDWVSQSK